MPFKSFTDYLQLEKNYSEHTVNAYTNDLSEFKTFISNEFNQESIEQIQYTQIRSPIISFC